MAKDPEYRCQTAAEVIEELDRIEQQIPPHPVTSRLFTNADTMKITSRRPKLAWGKLTQDISSKKVKVLVVDDSLMMCKAITGILASMHEIQVVGTCNHPEQLLDMIPRLGPDVITLDVNMPQVDGVALLKRIMVDFPLPVVMISDFTEEGAMTTFDCLLLGAVDFLWKGDRAMLKKILASTLVRAAHLSLKQNKIKAVRKFFKNNRSNRIAASSLVVMVASRNCYSNYLKIIPAIHKNIPCTLLAIHDISSPISRSYLQYLNRHSHIPVKIAKSGEVLRQGVCYLMANDSPLELVNVDHGYPPAMAVVENGRSTESLATLLLTSAAVSLSLHKIAVFLSGDCGKQSQIIRHFRDNGGKVLCQHPSNCLYPDMVDALIREKLADLVVLDVDIAPMLWHLIKSH